MVTSVSSRIVVEIRREPHGSDLGRYGETRDRRDAGARGHAHWARRARRTPRSVSPLSGSGSSLMRHGHADIHVRLRTSRSTRLELSYTSTNTCSSSLHFSYRIVKPCTGATGIALQCVTCTGHFPVRYVNWSSPARFEAASSGPRALVKEGGEQLKIGRAQ